MQGKSSASSEKAEKIVLDRLKHRMVDVVYRADNADHFEKIVRDKFNYFYENLVFSALDTGIRKGKALDIGTQFGMCALNLAKQDYDFEITSFQDTASFIKASKKFAGRDMTEGIEWTKGKPESLPFEDNAFDLVVSGFDMHHWEDPVETFNEIERVMKTKSALVIGDFRRDAFKLMIPVLKAMSYFVKNEKLYDEMKSSFSSSYTRNELEELLKNSSLKGCDVSKDLQFVYVVKGWERKKRVVVKVAAP